MIPSVDEPFTEWSRPEGSYHAHFDCFSGAAGDMMLAACLDASDNGPALLTHIQYCLERGLTELQGEFSLDMKRVLKSEMGSIAANCITVKSRYNHSPAPVPIPSEELADEAQIRHSHSSEHSHAHIHEDDHAHDHSHSYERHHSSHSSCGDTKEITSSSHSHSHNHASGPLRNLPQIRKMLMDASPTYIPAWVRDHAIQAFTELAMAEATTHGASVEHVHFHEVGAIDSIVDTVGTLLALHCLGVCTFSCSRLPLGEGTVWTAHGLLPVPAPATLRLLVDMPICPGPSDIITGELVTPTAAALLRVLTSGSSGRPPCMTIRKIGIGAGTKDFTTHANILRLIIGDSVIRK